MQQNNKSVTILEKECAEDRPTDEAHPRKAQGSESQISKNWSTNIREMHQHKGDAVILQSYDILFYSWQTCQPHL